jgi:hypothetical protein
MMGAGGDFEALAAAALGTDDPERIRALKEAVMACMDGDYGDEEEAAPESGGDMAAGKGSTLSKLFG